MEKREGEYWTSRLGRSPREDRGERDSGYLQPTFLFSTRHPVETRPFILVIDLAALLLLLPGALFPEEGTTGECKGIGWGRSAKAFVASTPGPCQVSLQPCPFAFSVCFLLFGFPFCVWYTIDGYF